MIALVLAHMTPDKASMLLAGLSLGSTALLLAVAVAQGLRSARATGNLVV